MTIENAAKLDWLLTTYGLRTCLELGFYHGVSSAYIAAILQRNGYGMLTTIDRHHARSLTPNIEQILTILNLRRYVDIHYEERSYTWRLMKMLEQNREGFFDFCYIDGGHSWDNTGFAFFLVEKLLKPGGWLLFDDLNWTFKSMQRGGKTPEWLRRMPAEEVATPQVRKVWELLVKSHPSFSYFHEDGKWGYARKKAYAG